LIGWLGDERGASWGCAAKDMRVRDWRYGAQEDSCCGVWVEQNRFGVGEAYWEGRKSWGGLAVEEIFRVEECNERFLNGQQ